MPLIDCESHYFTAHLWDFLRGRNTSPYAEGPSVYAEPSAPDMVLLTPERVEQGLREIGDARVALMDKYDIAAQVISLSMPGTDQFTPDVGLPLAREANDVLAAAIARHPRRLIGFATLAPLFGEQSAMELERCVTQLGFKGANIHSHIGDTYPDDKACWPIFEAAERLDVPINIHPTLPHGSMLGPYKGYGWTLAGPGLAFGHETALAVARMIFGRVFDAFPKLKIMLGHCGEGITFWMYRLDLPYRAGLSDHPKLDRLPSECITHNLWCNISANYHDPAFLACLAAVGPDRIMFGSDHPWGRFEESVGYVEAMPVQSHQDREKIKHLNAERLFGLTPSEPTAAGRKESA